MHNNCELVSRLLKFVLEELQDGLARVGIGRVEEVVNLQKDIPRLALLILPFYLVFQEVQETFQARDLQFLRL